MASFDPEVQRSLAATLVALGVGCAGLAFGRWKRTERALRGAQPLPSPVFAPVLCAGLVALGIVVLILVGAA